MCVLLLSTPLSCVLLQVTANHDRLAQLEQVRQLATVYESALCFAVHCLQEKEQLMLDLQLLSIKHEREQKVILSTSAYRGSMCQLQCVSPQKVASLELARANPSSSSSPIGSPSLATPPVSTLAPPCCCTPSIYSGSFRVSSSLSVPFCKFCTVALNVVSSQCPAGISLCALN